MPCRAQARGWRETRGSFTQAKTQPSPWVLSWPLIVSTETPVSPEHPAAPGTSGVHVPAATSPSTF